MRFPKPETCTWAVVTWEPFKTRSSLVKVPDNAVVGRCIFPSPQNASGPGHYVTRSLLVKVPCDTTGRHFGGVVVGRCVFPSPKNASGAVMTWEPLKTRSSLVKVPDNATGQHFGGVSQARKMHLGPARTWGPFINRLFACQGPLRHDWAALRGCRCG